ncbi:hypothetical protein LCGC14_0737710 [marine sediment metagenome]|uniref:Uncharacterized protein n=1 Tax=marine sediment metagenome TaxID=412755 RepID=A0A0F9Q7M1_9ZZZZ
MLKNLGVLLLVRMFLGNIKQSKKKRFSVRRENLMVLIKLRILDLNVKTTCVQNVYNVYNNLKQRG